MHKKGYEKPVVRSEKIKIGVFGQYGSFPGDGNGPPNGIPANANTPAWLFGNCSRG